MASQPAMPSPRLALDMTVRLCLRRGYNRAQALWAIDLACGSIQERYAGTGHLSMAFIAEIRGLARHDLLMLRH